MTCGAGSRWRRSGSRGTTGASCGCAGGAVGGAVGMRARAREARLAEGERLTNPPTPSSQAHFELFQRAGAMDAVSVTVENNSLIRKKIRSLEDELERQLHSVNEVFAANRALRRQIDSMRRERAVQDAMYTEIAREMLRNQNTVDKTTKVRAASPSVAAADAARAGGGGAGKQGG